jgi:nitrilase
VTQRDAIVRVAAIQASPIFLDRDASLEKAVGLIKQAAAKGAALAAFGEGWLPGYPIHARASSAAAAWWDAAADYLAQSIYIPGPTTDALCAAARDAGIDLVIGVSEQDSNTRGSAYSSLLFIGGDGEVLGRHRKLKPALHERVVWADGDAIDLRVHDRGYGCLSGLTGVEHQMVLPTYALAEQGTQIHVASWPGAGLRSPRHGAWPPQHLLSRAFAAQAGAYVICVGSMLSRDAVPDKYRDFLTDEFTGQSVIIDPRGEIIAGPAENETILVADCSLAQIRSAKVAFDCCGHSARRDQLQLFNQLTGGQGGQPEPEQGSGSAPPEQGASPQANAPATAFPPSPPRRSSSVA